MQGSFTESYLTKLETWLDCVIIAWLRMINPKSVNADTKKSLQNYIYETYTLVRIDQLYNIILEFDDSAPALEDLAVCLERTDLTPTLTSRLKKVLRAKLLHLGVNTTDIITAYVAAIRALRVLDPSGVILESVCDPLRKYLRTRDDTVRCIVHALVADDNGELVEELKKQDGLCFDDSSYEEDDVEDWENWTPDPVGGNGSGGSRKRMGDIISMLVNLYGSKELFVNEYRSLLSNRLLSALTYESDKEIRNLELLKKRFGEAPLHQCQVMLRDVGDSKRINSLLHAPIEDSELKKEPNDENSPAMESIRSRKNLAAHQFPVNSLILSAQFWPQFKEEAPLKLPEEVEKGLEAYTQAFEAMKGNRTLVWKQHLGFANIEVEIGGKTLNLTVSPVQAAIIWHFQVRLHIV